MSQVEILSKYIKIIKKERENKNLYDKVQN